MKIENKIARLMRNTAPARFFLPVGILLIVFGALTLGMRSEDGASKLLPIAMIAAGAAAAAFGVGKTLRAFRKSRELDESLPAGGVFPTEAFRGFKSLPEVTEYYFRFDGNSLRPGYVLEDADRQPVFTGKMLKNALVGPRSFAFTDHAAGSVRTHEIGHTAAATLNDEFFSVRSSFRFDGEDVWDHLHGRGLRIATDLHSSFPRLVYDVVRNGAPFAHIESCGVAVHEADGERQKFAPPGGAMYCRVWTDTADFETLFLTLFAIAETRQAVVE